MGPRASLEAVAKRKIPCPRRESNAGRPARSLVAMLTEFSRILPKYIRIVLLILLRDTVSYMFFGVFEV